jgi:hypothetical protein
MGTCIKAFAALFFCLLAIALPAQTKFTNKSYGISFEFPEGYKLHRGDLGDSYSLGYLGPIPMEFLAPGGERLATVEVPADLYPKTDLNAAFVTVSVNQYLTREECESIATDLPKSQQPLTIKIDGVDFRGASEGDAGLGHQFGGTYYHSFLAGTCYELGEGIATSGYGSVDGLQPVDAGRVVANLNKILLSLRIETIPDDFKVAPLATIKSFAVAPLNPHAGMYRLSWDVNSVDGDQVWLSAGCSGDLSIFETAIPVPEGHAIKCDVLRPTQSTHGSLDIELRNLSGGEIRETIRLFAKGRGAVSKALTVALPAAPVIISVARYTVYAGSTDGNVKIFAGHEVEISGVAFLPHQKLHIGAATLPVDSADGASILFKIPTNLPVGQYAMFLENDRGQSNVVTVQIFE